MRGKAGRPVTATSPGRKVTLSLRTTATVKARLVAAAEADGRNLSEEMERRIDQSFQDDGAADRALDFAFGEREAAFFRVLAQVVHITARDAMWVAGASETRGKDWLSQPYAFEQVARAIRRAVEAMRPLGNPEFAFPNPTPEEVRDDWLGMDPRPLARRIAERASATVLGAVVDPEHATQGLSAWAAPVARKLGSDLVERIAAAENAEQWRGVAERLKDPAIDARSRDRLLRFADKMALDATLPADVRKELADAAASARRQKAAKG